MIPDAIEEVTGYRIWDVTEGGRLRSYNSQYGYWKPGQNEALCMISPQYARRNGPDGLEIVAIEDAHGPIPDPRCNCGFWMLASMKALHEQGLLVPRDPSGFTISFGSGMATPQEEAIGRVVGMVKGWGRTIVASEGHRCQYAEVTSFLIHKRTDHLFIEKLQELAEAFAVPIVETKAAEPRQPKAYDPGGITVPASNTITWTSASTTWMWDDGPSGELSPIEKKKRSHRERHQALEEIRKRHRRRGRLP